MSRTGDGYSAWRLIAEELRAEIGDGTLRRGERLPGEMALAERFGVNRHTARQAIATLAADGLVESRRGSGTFVTGSPVLVHRIGARTRMSRSLEVASGGDGGSLGGRPGAASTARHRSRGVLHGATTLPAPPEVAARLDLEVGAPVLRIETVNVVGTDAGDAPVAGEPAAGEHGGQGASGADEAGEDGTPFALSTRWFDAARVPGIAGPLERTGSVTAALRECGIDDYLRGSTVIGARHATAEESAALGLGAGAVVLVSEALDTLPDGTPLQYLLTRFAAQRVKLDVEHG
ncbi:UTRA domain-containing protein [Brevibacterium litoralis]|uniref:UTRA domain-containing protein n=1 Tax=Brevibacterium litoralis TaxID=3138935 RepID=UPI0032EF7E85